MSTKKVIVTGGMGYIGSHTIVDLLEKGFNVVSIDNLSRANQFGIDGIRQITGVTVKNYAIDLCDLDKLRSVIMENSDAVGIIHFGAYKDVLESVNEPLVYYHNNISSTVNILKCAEEFSIGHFIFSSSCTVYGNIETLPVLEETPFGKPACPYALTKQVGEKMIYDMAAQGDMRFVLLRYFNPAGAHVSGAIGEFLHAKGNHLVPVITQVAAGIRPDLTINGTDYPTRDGTGLRDFIHVMDIADAHTLALNSSLNNKFKDQVEVFNLGTGQGITVLEAVKCFEESNGLKLNYKVGSRREGDIVAIYASNEKAKNYLGWTPKHSLSDIMKTAWNWQKKMRLLTK
ncbi:MAG: UDP-glucose 4-epimerase GalE [Bacteroidia bacterium]|nr:UDP-glucose 4-epimerase GalE [Bacteroidia bacterium]